MHRRRVQNGMPVHLLSRYYVKERTTKKTTHTKPHNPPFPTLRQRVFLLFGVCLNYDYERLNASSIVQSRAAKIQLFLKCKKNHRSFFSYSNPSSVQSLLVLDPLTRMVASATGLASNHARTDSVSGKSW